MGFISKWLLVEAALEGGHVWAAALVVFSSLISIIYIWRVVEVAYLQEPVREIDCQEAPLSLLIPMWVLLIANVYFGIDAQMTSDIAERAALALLRGTP